MVICEFARFSVARYFRHWGRGGISSPYLRSLLWKWAALFFPRAICYRSRPSLLFATGERGGSITRRSDDKTGQDMTGKDKTRQGKTGQDRTREGNERQDRERQDKTGKDWTRQD